MARKAPLATVVAKGRDEFFMVYDYVFNFFTSFGYFDRPTEHRRVVANIAASLRCGGTLVLDYLNVRAAAAGQRREETRTIDGATYRITRWSGTRHFVKRIEITEGSGSRPLTFVEQVVRFGLNDFHSMFARAGLAIEAVYGDYRLSPF